jgi:hypothetical protein
MHSRSCTMIAGIRKLLARVPPLLSKTCDPGLEDSQPIFETSLEDNIATATARPSLHLRSDDFFFAAMAAMALIVVLIGFARTYFLAGLFRAPLPNRLVHIHAVAFTLWMALFITQVSLVAARRLDLHRRLGLFGFVLAIVMIVLGTVAGSDRLARHVAHPDSETVEGVRAFYAVSLADMFMFSMFVYFGYRNRFQPAVHKRLMWFATLAILDAGFDRWPVFNPYSLPVIHLICYIPLLLLLIGYDWWSTGKVQRVTIWSAIFLVFVQQIHQGPLLAPVLQWREDVFASGKHGRRRSCEAGGNRVWPPGIFRQDSRLRVILRTVAARLVV